MFLVKERTTKSFWIN